MRLASKPLNIAHPISCLHLYQGVNRVKLKGRLKLIYDMIPQCDILCDIGTDHALIPAYALLNKRCQGCRYRHKERPA